MGLTKVLKLKKAAITGLYCSSHGEPITSQDVYDVNEDNLFDGMADDTVSLYKKLLLNNPSRTRYFAQGYNDVVKAKTPQERAEAFHRISCEWMEDAARGVFEQTDLQASDIDFLIVNYMAGKTLPSLSSHLAGTLGLRKDVITVNMSDMGCSAAVAALDLGERLLRAENRPKRVLMLALEPVSNLFQADENKGAVVGNTLFGEGCAAVVMSTYREPALYEVEHTQRVIHADEESREAIKLAWNDYGPMIQLSKDIPAVAGRAIESNLKRLVPQFLPKKAKLQYLITKKIPRWQKSIDHWAIHPGGTAVLKGFQKQLRLADADLGPSYRVFQERSNMSSPSVLYALDNVERSAPKRGDSVLMMSFGSGFKVNSMILRKGAKRIYDSARKYAVVIGGTSGIGLDAAKKLSAEGYHTFIGSRRVGRPDVTFERVANATYIPLDVTCTESTQAFAKAVWRNSFGVDALVVSSGIAPVGDPLGRTADTDIIRTVNTNLTGAMLSVNALIPMLRRKAKVVLLNSILGRIPMMGSAAYCASKAGLHHFGESLELELNRAGRGITVHNLYPAYVETPMLDDVKSSGKTFLKPVQPGVVTGAIAQILEGGTRTRGTGYLLMRDRLITTFYRVMPGSFKRLLSSF